MLIINHSWFLNILILKVFLIIKNIVSKNKIVYLNYNNLNFYFLQFKKLKVNINLDFNYIKY